MYGGTLTHVRGRPCRRRLTFRLTDRTRAQVRLGQPAALELRKVEYIPLEEKPKRQEHA